MNQDIIKILLIIENETQAEFLEEIFEKKDNYKVSREYNGREIFEKLKNNPEEYLDTVIIIGYQLPDMNGLKIMSELKNLGCKFGFIFLTSDNIVERAIEAMKCGALDFISKSEELPDILPAIIDKAYLTQKERLEKIKIYREHDERRIALEGFETITREMNNGILIYDNNGVIEWMNNGYTKITGFTLQEHLKKYGGHYILKSYDNELKNEIKNNIEKNEPYSYTVKAKTSDNQNIWLLICLSPTLDEKGNLSKIVKVISDISEVKL